MSIDWEAATEEFTDWLGQRKGVIDPVEASVAVVKAALGDTDLYSWCPDCNGEGIVWTMSSGPDLDETSRSCGRCGEFEGMVKVWPESSE